MSKFNIIKSAKFCTLINRKHLISLKKISKITDTSGLAIEFKSFNKVDIQGAFFYSLSKQVKDSLFLFENTDDIFPFYRIDESDYLLVESTSYSKDKIDFFSIMTKDIFYEILTLKYSYEKYNDERYCNLLKKLPPIVISEVGANEYDILSFRVYVSEILSAIQHRSDSKFVDKVFRNKYSIKENAAISFYANKAPDEDMRIKCVNYINVFKTFVEEEMRAMKEFKLNCIKEWWYEYS